MKINNEFKIDNYLLKERKIFLYDSNDRETSVDIIKRLFVLDSIEHKPIYFYLDSPGGMVSNGLGIINIMKSIKSKIITIANTKVCSMATSIFVAGDERLAYKNSVFMLHDISSGKIGDSKKILSHTDYLKRLVEEKEKYLLKYTKLTKKDLEKARNVDLWLFAKEAKKKGLVDRIIK